MSVYAACLWTQTVDRDAFPGQEVFKMQVYYTVHVSYQRLSNVHEYYDMQ